MKSPCSWGHFEMRLSNVGLTVPKLKRFLNNFNLAEAQPPGYCNSASLIPPGSFIHKLIFIQKTSETKKYNRTKGENITAKRK